MRERGEAGLREPLAPAEVALAAEEAVDRTAERNRSGVVDAVRAVAALMVMCAHSSFIANNGQATGTSFEVRQMLGSGVLIFFSLSGYLIAGPFLRALVEGQELPSIRGYLVRRAARIYPAYWLAFAAVLILLWPAGGVRAYQYPVHLLLLQSSWPVNGEPTAIFFVAWTLGIEVAFYVFVPLAALVLRALHPSAWRPGRLALLTLAAGTASAAWVYIASQTLTGDMSRPALLSEIGLQMYLFAFCPGVIIALAATAEARGKRWGALRRFLATPWLTLPLAGLMWWLAYRMERSTTPFWVVNYQVAFVIGSGLFLAAAVTGGKWTRPFARVLAPVGLISYGIYLWHDIVIQYVWHHTSIGLVGGGAAWLGDTLLVALITLPIATVSWLWIERPAMRRAASWARRQRPAASSTPSALSAR